MKVTAGVWRCPSLLLKGWHWLSPCRRWIWDLQRWELSPPSDHWWKRQHHMDLLGASCGANTGFHCGLLQEHFAHMSPPPSFAGKSLWLHEEINVALQYAISDLDGLTFLFLWNIDQIYSFLKMLVVFSEGEVVFLLLASACLSHICAKYAYFLIRIFKLLFCSFTLNGLFGWLDDKILKHLLSVPNQLHQVISSLLFPSGPDTVMPHYSGICVKDTYIV